MKLPGRITAYAVAEVRPQVTGILQERLFKQGARVEAGQALYQIDLRPYRAAVSRNEAELVAVNGWYRTAEDMEPGHRGAAVQAFLDGGALVIAPLKS